MRDLVSKKMDGIPGDNMKNFTLLPYAQHICACTPTEMCWYGNMCALTSTHICTHIKEVIKQNTPVAGLMLAAG